jgi:hypothetical protein
VYPSAGEDKPIKHQQHKLLIQKEMSEKLEQYQSPLEAPIEQHTPMMQRCIHQ